MSGSKPIKGRAWFKLITLAALMLSWLLPFMTYQQYAGNARQDLPSPSALFLHPNYQIVSALIGSVLIVLLLQSMVRGTTSSRYLGQAALLLAVAHLLFAHLALILPMMHVF